MQLNFNKQVNVAIFSRSSSLLLMEDTLGKKTLSCVSQGDTILIYSTAASQSDDKFENLLT